MATTSLMVFLDSSALFAGIWLVEGGARMIFKLGEAGVIQLVVTSLVLTEVDNAVRRKAPGTLGALSLFLHKSNIQVIPDASKAYIEKISSIVHYSGDALIIASAWERQVDYFVTLDRKHFIDNHLLVNTVPFPIGTPGDFLYWYKVKIGIT